MNPAEIRDLNWQQLREHIEGMRSKVYDALQIHGPCTTRRLAERSEIDLLTVRPRVTELEQLGFAECVRNERGEGIYRALSYSEAHQRHRDRRAIASGQGVQQQLL